MDTSRYDDDARELRKEWGRRITAARQAKKWTQKYLAATAGVSYGAVAHWESGQSRPGMNQAFQLAELLEVDLEQLFPMNPSGADQRAELAPLLLEVVDMMREQGLSPAQVDVVADSLEFIATKMLER